jgi:hypothetical protein
LESLQAYLIAGVKASLIDGEMIDGGDGEEASQTKNYGNDSIQEMLFKKQITPS